MINFRYVTVIFAFGLLSCSQRADQSADAENISAIPDATQATAQNWGYNRRDDKIRHRAILTATNESTTVTNFAPPYSGGSKLAINIRKHPSEGLQVILTIAPGQMDCALEGCTVSASFDDGKEVRFSATPPSDGTSTAIFIDQAQRFTNMVKRSKSAVIEVGFFEGGRRQFEFNLRGLSWPPKPKDFPEQ